MTDIFAHSSRTPSDPATSIFAITPDDAIDLPWVTTALNVERPGSVRVTMADGTEGTLSIHPGANMPVRVRRVWLTGTTAHGIRGLY